MTTHDDDPITPDDPSSPDDRAPHLRSVPPLHTVSDRRPSRVTLRDETDLLALIPYTFGFHPEESLVMMLLSQGGRPMFARVDMPTTAEEADAACSELVHAAVANGGRRAVLVAYAAHDGAAFLAAEQAAEELVGAGFDVVLGLRTHGGRWWRLLPDPDLGEGVPYDLSAHPITATGVLEGRVTHGSRRQLAESLLPLDPDRLEEVSQAHAELDPLPTEHADLRAEAAWLERWVRGRVAAGGAARELPAGQVARVVRALADRDLRDVAWATITHDDADAHVRLWTDVVVQCPLDLLAPSAGLLAFSAWLSGHGALAWCAIDRALQSDPDHSLARLVAEALDGAMPPSTWRPVDRSSLSLLSG